MKKEVSCYCYGFCFSFRGFVFCFCLFSFLFCLFFATELLQLTKKHSLLQEGTNHPALYESNELWVGPGESKNIFSPPLKFLAVLYLLLNILCMHLSPEHIHIYIQTYKLAYIIHIHYNTHITHTYIMQTIHISLIYTYIIHTYTSYINIYSFMSVDVQVLKCHNVCVW